MFDYSYSTFSDEDLQRMNIPVPEFYETYRSEEEIEFFKRLQRRVDRVHDLSTYRTYEEYVRDMDNNPNYEKIEVIP